MKFGFLGDSLTHGYGLGNLTQRFSSLVSSYFGAEEINEGLDGSPITPDPWGAEAFLPRFLRMKKVDFLFVLGGTNDWGGTLAFLGEEGDEDEKTFYGAFASLCQAILQVYPKEKVLILLPPSCFHENPVREDEDSLNDFREAERKVASRFGLSVLDLSPLLPIPSTNRGSDYHLDGVHLSEKGHRIIADSIIDYLVNNGSFARK